mgnify:CR=1 FL=1
MSPQPEKPSGKYDEVANRRLQAVSNFFSGTREKLTGGAAIALTAPERAKDVGSRMVESGRNIFAKCREQVGQAGQRFNTRWEQGKERTGNRLNALNSKASSWGLSVRADVADGIVALWNRPQALLHEQRAKFAERRLERNEARGAAAETTYGSEIERREAAIAQLKAEITQLTELQGAERAVRREGKEKAYGEIWEHLLAAREAKGAVSNSRKRVLELQQAA